MARKIVMIAAALALTAVGGAGVRGFTATYNGRAVIARLVADHQGLTIGGMIIDPFGGRIMLRDVGIAQGSLHVYARRLDLPLARPDFSVVTQAFAASDTGGAIRLAQWPGTGTSAKEAPDDAAPHGGIELKIPGQTPAPEAESVPAPPPPSTQVGAASASDVTIVSGATTYVIKKIDLTGTSLTSADIVALFDTKSPETIEARLKKLNANSIVISEITSTETTPNRTFKADVTQILLANVASGRIGAASAAGATFSGTGSAKDAPAKDTPTKDASDEATIKTGAIQASGIDLALFVHLLNTTRTDDAETLKTLSEALTINDISLTGPDKATTMTIAAIRQKDLKARPLKFDLKALDDATSKTPPGGDAGKPDKSAAVADDIVRSYEVGSFSIDKMDIATTDKSGPIKLGIAKIGLEDFRDRKLGAFTIRDFTVNGTDVTFSLGTFDVSAVAIPRFVKSADGAPDAPATDNLPSVGKADIGQLAVDVTTKAEDGSANKVKFTLAHAVLSSDQTPGKPPTHGAFSFDNLVIAIADIESPGVAAFSMMGYDKFDLSGAIASTYDPAAETLAIPKLALSGVGMGSVEIAIDFSNVNKGIMSGNEALIKASALAVLLKRLDLKVQNSGLFDKAMDWKAKQDGKTPAAERAEAIDFVSVQLPASLGGNPVVTKVGAAVAAFIAAPKNLHIGISAKDGLGAADMGLLGSPDELLKRLDIQAEANR